MHFLRNTAPVFIQYSNIWAICIFTHQSIVTSYVCKNPDKSRAWRRSWRKIVIVCPPIRTILSNQSSFQQRTCFVYAWEIVCNSYAASRTNQIEAQLLSRDCVEVWYHNTLKMIWVVWNERGLIWLSLGFIFIAGYMYHWWIFSWPALWSC